MIENFSTHTFRVSMVKVWAQKLLGYSSIGWRLKEKHVDSRWETRCERVVSPVSYTLYNQPSTTAFSLKCNTNRSNYGEFRHLMNINWHLQPTVQQPGRANPVIKTQNIQNTTVRYQSKAVVQAHIENNGCSGCCPRTNVDWSRFWLL